MKTLNILHTNSCLLNKRSLKLLFSSPFSKMSELSWAKPQLCQLLFRGAWIPPSVQLFLKLKRRYYIRHFKTIELHIINTHIANTITSINLVYFYIFEARKSCCTWGEHHQNEITWTRQVETRKAILSNGKKT